jgi:tetratricopeptide (TPR) repeat protein
VSVNPQHKQAWINLGMALAQLQRYDEAIAAFGRAASPAQAQCNLGFLLATQGRRDQAREAYRTALQLDPTLQIARTALRDLAPPPSATVRSPDAGPPAIVSPSSAVEASPGNVKGPG